MIIGETQMQVTRNVTSFQANSPQNSAVQQKQGCRMIKQEETITELRMWEDDI